MTPLLEVRDLHKEYKGRGKITERIRVKAVNGVSFSIRPGICFGLLGPNGAGKTTTIEMIEGIKPPTQGEIFFRGEPVGEEFKQRAGIQFQGTALPDYLKVGEALKMFASFYRHSTDLDKLADLCNLKEFWDRDAHELSGGQRQRLLLAIALVNDPELVFLDEPTTGLDPQARRNFWDLIKNIKNQGKTVVLTTHYMEEAYTLCDEIVIMDRGKIIAQGAPDVLLKQYFDTLTLEIPSADFLAKIPNPASLPWPAVDRQGHVEIQTKDVNEALKHLLAQGVTLERLRIRSRTLEDLFIELTGREIRDE